MILNDVVQKARDLVNNAVTRTITVYDSSKNSIIVSGLTLDGVVKANLSSKKIGELSSGTDQTYFGFYDVWDNLTLEVTLLPTAKSVSALELLSYSQRMYKGHTRISIVENGQAVGTYLGYITTTPSIDLEKEAGDRVYTFVLKQPLVTAYTLSNSQTTITNDSNNTLSESLVNQQQG